jgi:hypothetical protein
MSFTCIQYHYQNSNLQYTTALIVILAASNGKSVHGTKQADELTVAVRLANVPSRATEVPEKLPTHHGA